MNLTHYITMNYKRKSGLLAMQKRTQTNPILPAYGGFVCLRRGRIEYRSTGRILFLLIFRFQQTFQAVGDSLAEVFAGLYNFFAFFRDKLPGLAQG